MPDTGATHPAAGAEIAERVGALIQAAPPAETTHWTASMNGQDRRDQRLLRAARMARPWLGGNLSYPSIRYSPPGCAISLAR
jgi:hypothetical protein